MPKWLEDVVLMTYKLNPNAPGAWKRLRIAVTKEELEEYKAWQGHPEFIHAVRGMPLQIEEHPLHPEYKMELK